MTRYLLDSNICIAWLKNHKTIVQHIIAVGDDQVCLCAPVKAELWYGACKSQRIAENKASLSRLFSDFLSLPFDDNAALYLGDIRAHLLAKQGTPIGPYDLQIAAIALTHGLTVVNNTREFTRVPGLVCVDWLL